MQLLHVKMKSNCVFPFHLKLAVLLKAKKNCIFKSNSECSENKKIETKKLFGRTFIGFFSNIFMNRGAFWCLAISSQSLHFVTFFGGQPWCAACLNNWPTTQRRWGDCLKNLMWPSSGPHITYRPTASSRGVQNYTNITVISSMEF
jgi:hypothetical protein